MLARRELDAQEALVCTMVLVASAGGLTDREIGVMSGLVQTVPVFHNFTSNHLDVATDAAVGLLREDDGLNHAGHMIREALDEKLRETAYVLACEVVAADQFAEQSTLQMLEFVMTELELDPLVAAAIERATRARYRRLKDPGGLPPRRLPPPVE